MDDATFLKSRRNHSTERVAHGFLLRDRRFQKPNSGLKKRILASLNVGPGKWSSRTFDLVMTPAEREPISTINLPGLIDEITLVEVKATKDPIHDAALNGFWFGSTQTQYDLAKALGDRYRYAFVVLNDVNIYGRWFFMLLTPDRVEASTQYKRVQWQVNFRRDMLMPTDPNEGPFHVPEELGELARESLPGKDSKL